MRARGEATALREAHRLGINPGGDVELFPVPEEHEAETEGLRGRLLSRRELEGAGLA